MEADSFRIAKVFSNGGDIHFRLPYFQREYAWKEENWLTLLEDITDLYDGYQVNENIEHFMGSLVVVQEGMIHGTVPVFKLVDGQQRLITISLILCALAESIKDTAPDKYQKIRKYITNPDETGEHKYKLLPTAKHKDRETYKAILRGRSLSEIEPGSRILDAYNYFKSKLQEKLASGVFSEDQLFLVMVNCLQVVFIQLNSGEKPYQIFESLNAKGKPLTQADLVRNYIAMKLPEARQPEIFENHWSKIEEMLQESRYAGKSGLGELTAFIRHYLAYRSGALCNSDHVYERFRDRIENEFNTDVLFENEVKTLQRFAGYYDGFLRPENVQDSKAKIALARLNTLEMATGYPFLLAMRDAVHNEKITNDEYLEGLAVLENYIVRRYLAGEPTNYLNKIFPTFWKDIDNTRFIPSLKEILLTHNYPSDFAVKQKGMIRSFYDSNSTTRAKTTLVFETINRHLSLRNNQGGFAVLDGDPSIEHILPQTLSEEWKRELGDQYSFIYNQNINTLGNLTLVTAPWNSELSNSAFSIKKDRLAQHALKLNEQYFSQNIDRWNEQAIKTRAEYLLSQIQEIWPAIGEPPAPTHAAGTYPFRLTFLGNTFPVASWRDVAENTTEVIIQKVTDFDVIANTLPSYLSKNPFPIKSRQLTNSWYMNVNLSAASIKGYCRTLITKSGFEIKDWQVEER